ncbi:DUF2946 family protein [Acinetobacter bohemicus]|uniref:DUF2946 family protein n=1 Tax=Acinetobacter lwoffii TaxID=28090 RepID=A0A9D2ZZC0_ACILW|nr:MULTISPECIES: DUF2946 family protein [unclassified Acinetobacter]MDM1782394.1 DUF2946 family protein [Acinetobacter indicus]HJF28681.1 DUF2946 family protein [Acinetobacter lwoffii]MCO8045476.1 DUF2946 family protein [Acinetobacter sp. S4397-1]QKQ71075.1 DUF2946 domain-containing protein [Acinetobacter sp. 10FS3-1]TQR63084.1 DUF2946 domain-containing protein [Acinetobacter sp. RF14B]
MVLRGGLLLSLVAVFLQIAVFLQPLLPEQYQVAPVCETITRALLSPVTQHSSASHADSSHLESHSVIEQSAGHDHHDPSHQCQYCTVYGNLILPPELEVQEVLDRILVRLIAFEKAFKHVWFVLQQLFLIPQGRAPPAFT